MAKRKNIKKSIRESKIMTVISIIVVVIIICICLLLREIGISEDVFGILALVLGFIGYRHGRKRRGKHKESIREKNKITFISIIVIVIIFCICLFVGEIGVSEDVVFCILGLVCYVLGYHQGRTGRGKHKEIP
ncbi:hypothetical protein [Bacillus sp. OV166]|uniref:hypothetical protein n=1 Tax=Bacillus sp. OV166 TaxID=1882763 RepID=UPI000B451E74|nr:hypothetical protein [Bacillus sp. OV166]